jgi:peptidoglycan hydrolase CwlO-like protein
MTEDAVLEILKRIQKDIGDIKSTLSEMRSEMDGQFDLMMSRGSKVDGLEKAVAALAKRITALERR